MSNNNDNKPVRRIVNNQPSVLTVPPVETLIADAMSIIELELVKFKTKVRQGKSLDPNEGRLLNGYVKSLVELAKEDREQAKSGDFSKMSNEEIIELLKGKPLELKGTPTNDDSDS